MIMIKDNGPGIALKKPNLTATHQGFAIADEAIILFKKLTGRRITYTFEPCSTTSPDSFTTVTVEIEM